MEAAAEAAAMAAAAAEAMAEAAIGCCSCRSTKNSMNHLHLFNYQQNESRGAWIALNYLG